MSLKHIVGTCKKNFSVTDHKLALVQH